MEQSRKVAATPVPAEPRPCSLCPKLCHFACPVAEANADESATPTAMMQAWEDARAGRLDWQTAAEALQPCSGCEACRAPCEFERELPALLATARAEAWQHDAVPAPVRDAHATHLEHGTPFGPPHRAADDAARDAKGRVLLWPGCRAGAERPEHIDAAPRLLAALGATHVSLPARDDVPACCGAFLHCAGDRTGAQVTAAGLEQYFNRQRTVVFLDSSCLGTVRRDWPRAGTAVTCESLSLPEYLVFFDERIAELGRAACERAEAEDRPLPKLWVHDACGLHRRLGRGGLRAVLEAATGQEPSTLGPSPDRAGCCGSGDFLDLRSPEHAAATAADLGRAALPADAWLITADGGCVSGLRRAFPEHRVDDTLGFLLAWLGPELP